MYCLQLTITFTFLKIQPEYPPTKYDDKKAWLVRQWTDDFMTRTVIDKTTVDEIDLKYYFDDLSFLDGLSKIEKLQAIQSKLMEMSKYYSIYTDEDHTKLEKSAVGF